MTEATRTGPLTNIKIVEMGGIGPGRFCAMLLSDLGADIIRIERAVNPKLVGPNSNFRHELMHRGRRSVAVDLKNPEGREVVLSLVESADAFIDVFRPGVTERLGIGPDECLARNPKIIYGRMTGYGQSGPMAKAAGHDINYIAQSGLLSLIGRGEQPPTPPLSLLGDFAGGGMTLALGILAALLEVRTSGIGQVIDAAMSDGAATLGTAFFGFWETGAWNKERGTNIVDSGAPFYDVYETKDGRWLAIGAIEPAFYSTMLGVIGVDESVLPPQYEQEFWPATKGVIAEAIRSESLEEWLHRAEGRDACMTAVLTVDEASENAHNVARQAFVSVAGITQPAPAPHFSRTPTTVDSLPPIPGEHTIQALRDWRVSEQQLQAWQSSGAISQISAQQ